MPLPIDLRRDDEGKTIRTVVTLSRVPDSGYRSKGMAGRLDDRAGLIGGGAGCDAATWEMGKVADGRHLGVRIPIGDDARC